MCIIETGAKAKVKALFTMKMLSLQICILRRDILQMTLLSAREFLQVGAAHTHLLRAVFHNIFYIYIGMGDIFKWIFMLHAIF